MIAVVEQGDADAVGLMLRCGSGERAKERTIVHYSRSKQSLTLYPTRSSLEDDFLGRAMQRAPLALGADEPLKLQVFLDRSIIEVFANGRLCLTKRIYPDAASLGTSFFAWEGKATLRSLDVWNMASAWE